MLNYNAFYYFLELCSAGSFTLAAENLHLTRSALSMSIKNLELELGFPLFIRSHDGVSLTPEGKQVEHYAQIAFSAFKEIEQLANKNIYSMNLDIYTDPGSGDKSIPYIISEYHKLYPGGNISIHAIGNLTLEEIFALNNNAVVLRTFEENSALPASIEHIVLDKAPAVLALAWDFPIIAADVKSISMKDILKLPLISISNGEQQPFQNKMLSHIHKFGEPNIVFTAQNMNMMHPLIQNKIGVMFYPYFKSLLKFSNTEHLRFVKIKKAPKFILALCYSKDMSDEKIAFISDFFKQVYDVQ